MDIPPPVQFTKVREGSVAYQVLGEGERDFVYVPGFIGNLDMFWENPYLVRFLTHVASYGRLIFLDRRGCGLSDRLPADASMLEEWTYDALGVMDTVGSEHATLIGFDTGTPMALYTAATFPDRVDALILMQAYQFSTVKEIPDEMRSALLDVIEANWGDGSLLVGLNPDLSEGLSRFVAANAAKYERASMGRGEVRSALDAMATMDVRDAVGSVRVPTLIVHSTQDALFPVEQAVDLADRLPSAKLVLLENPNTHGWVDNFDVVLPEVDQFLGGDHAPMDNSRVLATVLFSDIVGSTERAVAEGDRRWRSMLETHDSVVRSSVESHQGRFVKSTGDGVLATFDGPAKAINATLRIRDALSGLGIEVYQGLHTGEIERRGEDISGLAVHIAARVAALAKPGQVLVSRTVKDLVVGSGVEFIDGGVHTLKGVPDEWQIYAVGNA